MLGLEYKDDRGRKFSGRVEYKMKNIRFQNKQLKLHGDFPKPNHVYFDDDGNPCEVTDTVKLYVFFY